MQLFTTVMDGFAVYQLCSSSIKSDGLINKRQLDCYVAVMLYVKH